MPLKYVLSTFGTARGLIPGTVASACVALAASYLSEHYGGPALLLALLLGFAFNYLAELPKTSSGVEFSARTILRVGVALLGARITFAELDALGLETVLIVVSVVAMAIVAGYWIGRALRLPAKLAVLSAGSVAICGASAALAIASVLPGGKRLEQSTIVTVTAVTSTSTVAMLLYPMIVTVASLDHQSAGVFIGSTVHDVAQVTGAAYMISVETGDMATIVKLLRVACLLPAAMVIGLVFRSKQLSLSESASLVPWFLLVFVALVVVGSLGFISDALRSAMSGVSQACLLVAVAALGMRTSIGQLVSIGPSVLLAILLQSILLAGTVLLILTNL